MKPKDYEQLMRLGILLGYCGPNRWVDETLWLVTTKPDSEWFEIVPYIDSPKKIPDSIG